MANVTANLLRYVLAETSGAGNDGPMPCPFCGKENGAELVVFRMEYFGEKALGFAWRCFGCGCQGPFFSLLSKVAMEEHVGSLGYRPHPDAADCCSRSMAKQRALSRWNLRNWWPRLSVQSAQSHQLSQKLN